MNTSELLQHMLTFFGNGFINPGTGVHAQTGIVWSDFPYCPMCGQTENERHLPDCKMVVFIEYIKEKAEEANENSSSH